MLINKFFQSFLQASQVPLAGLLLSLGVAASSSTPILASSVEKSVTSSTSLATATVPADKTSKVAAIKEINSGIYLFGQSSKPEQVGQEYVVFEAQGGKVVGAFYMPSSEFSCFYGTLDNNQMNLTVADTYEETTYSHSIALQRNSLVASQNPVGLEGYQPIGTVSDSDKQVLRSCQDKYQQ